MLLPWQHSWLQSFSVDNQYSNLQSFKGRPEDLARNKHISHIVLTFPIGLLGVDNPCLRSNLGILVLTVTGPAA